MREGGKERRDRDRYRDGDGEYTHTHTHHTTHTHTQKPDSSPNAAITVLKEQISMLQKRKEVMEHKANQVPSLCARLLRSKPVLPPCARRGRGPPPQPTHTHTRTCNRSWKRPRSC